MMEADRQHFYPTWGLSSQTDWAVAYATGLVPESEMVGARYAGWSPVMDLKNMYDPATKPRWSRLQQCDDIYGRAGIKRDGALAEVFALAMCDGLLDLAALGRAAGGTLNRTTFNAAVDAMSWQSAFFPSTQVTTRRPDGVVAVPWTTRRRRQRLASSLSS
jgi:hypothetical protein